MAVHAYAPAPAPTLKATTAPAPATAPSTQPLRLLGARLFRERLVCATLAHRALRLDRIRSSSSESVGLAASEVSFLRLLCKVSSGARVNINASGTSLRYTPGTICGGVVAGVPIQHTCPPDQPINYYLEGLFVVALFSARPIDLTLEGDTSGIESFAHRASAVLRLCLPDTSEGSSDIRVRVVRRGQDGLVHCRFPVVHRLNPVSFVSPGLVTRCGGTAMAWRSAAHVGRQLADSASRVLRQCCAPERVYIRTETVGSGSERARTSGAEVYLWAETTTGVLYCSDDTAADSGDAAPCGARAAHRLLEEIGRGGCVDSSSESTLLLLMLLGPEDVSRVRLGAHSSHSPLSMYTVECLRLYKAVFGSTFKLVTDSETNTIIASCLGKGYQNFNRKAA